MMSDGSWRLLRPAVLALGAAVLLFACGCDILGQGWTRKQEDVSKAKVGWTLNQVHTNIGKPSYKIEYDGVRTGWEEWVYPTGSIFFYRLVVKHVVPRSEGTPLPKRPSSRAAWPVEVGEDDMEPKSDFGEF